MGTIGKYLVAQCGARIDNLDSPRLGLDCGLEILSSWKQYYCSDFRTEIMMFIKEIRFKGWQAFKENAYWRFRCPRHIDYKIKPKINFLPISNSVHFLY